MVRSSNVHLYRSDILWARPGPGALLLGSLESGGRHKSKRSACLLTIFDPHWKRGAPQTRSQTEETFQTTSAKTQNFSPLQEYST